MKNIKSTIDINEVVILFNFYCKILGKVQDAYPFK